MAATESARRRSPRAETPPDGAPTPVPTPEPEPSPPPDGEPAPTPPGPDDDEGELEGGGAGGEMPTAMAVVCPNCGHEHLLAPPVEMFFPKQLAQYATCVNCDGRGSGLTGSRVGDFIEDKCPVCEGKGYVLAETGRAITAPPADAPPWQGAQWDSDRGIWV